MSLTITSMSFFVSLIQSLIATATWLILKLVEAMFFLIFLFGIIFYYVSKQDKVAEFEQSSDSHGRSPS